MQQISRAQQKDLVSLSLETDFDTDCNYLDKGHTGKEILKLLKKADTPGYALSEQEVRQKRRLVYTEEKTRRLYVLVANSPTLTTDEFYRDDSPYAKHFFDALLFASSSGIFLGAAQKSEINPLLSGIQKVLDQMYEESIKDFNEWKDEEHPEED